MTAIEKYSQILRTEPIILSSDYYAYAGLKGARFDLGNASISLIASEDDGSPIARFITQRGEGVNHITFEVTDLERLVEEWAGTGLRFLTRHPLPFQDGQVIFSHPESLHGVQIAFMEPVERPKASTNQQG